MIRRAGAADHLRHPHAAGRLRRLGGWVLGMAGDASMQAEDALGPLIHDASLHGLADAHRCSGPIFTGLPPVLIQVGSSETLLADGVRIAGRLGAAEVRVDLAIRPRMIRAA